VALVGFVGATARVWSGRENEGGKKVYQEMERLFLLAQVRVIGMTYVLEKQSPMCHG
jgi:hypothetical protein